MNFHFDHSRRYSPTALYQTAIQLMYDLAQAPWGQKVYIVDSKKYKNYNVIIVFVNPREPDDTGPQLQVCHCVAALYRVVTVITNGMMFFEVKSELNVQGRLIGAMTVIPFELNGGNITEDVDHPSLTLNVKTASEAEWGFEKGQIQDPIDSRYIINYQFLGKRINGKEVSLVVLEALTSAAPHSPAERCKEIMVSSPGGDAVIVLEAVEKSGLLFTYQHATRALKLLYQIIVAPEKKFGDLMLELVYDEGGTKGEKVVGELRMLRVVDGKMQNGTDWV